MYPNYSCFPRKIHALVYNSGCTCQPFRETVVLCCNSAWYTIVRYDGNFMVTIHKGCLVCVSFSGPMLLDSSTAIIDPIPKCFSTLVHNYVCEHSRCSSNPMYTIWWLKENLPLVGLEPQTSSTQRGRWNHVTIMSLKSWSHITLQQQESLLLLLAYLLS